MSRYLALLESHLPAALASALHDLAAQANAAGRAMYVTGATMRDAFAGLQVRELELVLEGEPLKLNVPDGLPVHVCMSAVEEASRAGGRPKRTAVSIHEYLRSRAFSVNAIALSVTRSSRGLLLDPTNGAADIQSREIRALSSQTFQARPVRLLELLRLRVRLGLRAYARTEAWFEEAVASGAYRRIKAAALRAELERVAAEPKALEILEAWEGAGLLRELLPMIAGEKLNRLGFARLQKTRQLIPFGVEFALDEPGLFLRVLTAELSAKDRAAFVAAAGFEAGTEWMKLGRRVSKAEKDLSSSAVHNPSQIYDTLMRAGATVTLLLALESDQRVVQDRVRNFLTKYLPAVRDAGPGVAVARLLDARPKRMAAEAGAGTASVRRSQAQ